MSTISFLVPTIGRRTLSNTIKSIEARPGDEIVIVGNVVDWMCANHASNVRYIPCNPGGDWGHSERNFAMPLCRGQYIAHIDDDDVYAPGARAEMEEAMQVAKGRPIIFRMRYPNGVTIWRETTIQCGNVGTPMFLTPNSPTKFGTWGPFVGGDCHFLETSKWTAEEYVWRPEIVAIIGRNAGEVAPA
jgi:hypothetical protein